MESGKNARFLAVKIDGVHMVERLQWLCGIWLVTL